MTAVVKICGLKDRAIVNAAIEAGADAVGFVFASSPRRVSIAQALEAAADVPQSVMKIAVMLHPAADDWNNVAREFRPDVLQTDVADFDYLEVPDDVQRWPVIREGQSLAKMPDTFVYEGSKSGQGQRVDWKRAAEIAACGRMILAGGLSADNVASAIETVAPWGVDVSSAVEASPGVKDRRKIESFIKAAKSARTKN